MIEGKKIVLGITGSIAAYKACLIARLLIKKGADVQVVMTPAAKEFITPLTLSTLTRKPVVSEFFDRRDGTWHSHVALGVWADAMIVAPCTASTIGKMANGIADNMLTATYLSMKAPVFIAPAMDVDMYSHPSTRHNMDTLRSFGNHIIEPGDGFLASGLEGKGRMEEPERIVDVIDSHFDDVNHAGGGLQSSSSGQPTAASATTGTPLRGKRIVVTAGPTYEKIDPVRFIGNYSSGKMGFAIANECAARGADVTLICGPVHLPAPCPSIKRIDVESCQQMYDAAVKAFGGADIAILSAAVADFRPANVSDTKIKRGKGDLSLCLKPTHDIAAELGKMKTPRQLLIGFALETDNEEPNARAKLESKNLDFIVLNSTRNAGTTFCSDYNKISIITRDGSFDYTKKPKTDVAKDIVDKIVNMLPV